MYRKRIYQLILVFYFINSPKGNKLFELAAKIYKMDKEDLYVSIARGFKPGESFIERFRMKPCAPMLHFI